MSSASYADVKRAYILERAHLKFSLMSVASWDQESGNVISFDALETEGILIEKTFSVDNLRMEVVDSRAASLRIIPDST